MVMVIKYFVGLILQLKKVTQDKSCHYEYRIPQIEIVTESIDLRQRFRVWRVY